jgi:hypothetical protein
MLRRRRAGGGKQLFSDEDRERCADGTADDPVRQAIVFEGVELGVIAGPGA